MKTLKLFLAALFFCLSAFSQNPVSCTGWLSTNTNGQFANLGALNVPGNQITVEATFNRTGQLNFDPNTGLNDLPGFLISKHSFQSNINYALYPNGCAISTRNAQNVINYYPIFQNCTFQLNRNYHVALVYDGTVLTFYRDGFLMSQIPCSGNLVLNSLSATVGQCAGSTSDPTSQFKGYINEVRIWNVARTQTEIQTYMFSTIPSPATQTGLVGYYRFNSLVDLTGNNPAATLSGGAASGMTNTSCTFTPIGCCGPNTSSTVNKCVNQNIVLNPRPGATSYSWSPATGLSATNIQNPVCSVGTSTTYIVHVFDGTTNCTNDDTIHVNVVASPVSNLRDTSICSGDTIQLNAGSGNSYSWSPIYNISNTNIGNPLVWPAANTTYVVTITNQNGCSITDSVTVTVSSCTVSCEDSCNWNLNGNSNVKVQNFIGPKNNADFKIRTNNIQRAIVTAAGNIGINTPTPGKLLDVNGEAAIRNLPTRAVNDNIVFANASGELKSLATPNDNTQYLSGDGTWQPIPTGTGGTVGADQGCTIDIRNNVVLGDVCGKGGSPFIEDREISMANHNLYFNSNKEGKLYMGNSNTRTDEETCRELFTRLEINAEGLNAKNDYASPTPSPSGLRFSNLTSADPQISNETGGVLSLDKDGDVIWVNGCCEGKTTARLDALEARLQKLEAELATSKNESVTLKGQFSQMDVILKSNNIVILNQNVPNPFAENTVITYNIPKSFRTAQIIFSSLNGEIIKTIDIKTSGKGLVNVYANDISSGLYTYSLLVDGKIIDTKKMIKQ